VSAGANSGDTAKHSIERTNDMSEKKCLIGEKFHKLTVISEAAPRRFANSNGPVRYWLCRCDCGEMREVQQSAWIAKRFKSCGCHNKEVQRERMTTHGAVKTREYSSWKHAKQRCYNPKHESYHNYGGRGITMCDRWKESPENFLADMGPCPKGCTLDRIDTNGNYEPSNCKWSTKKEQDRNRRTNKVYTVKGVTGCIVELCEHFEISKHSFYTRRALGWSVEKSLTEPLREPPTLTVKGVTGTLRELSKHFEISENRVFRRIQNEWDIEDAFLTPVRQGNYRTG
jgi:hypothetical protein